MDLYFTKKGIKLFNIFGIQIYLNYSWFIIFALVVWSLAEGYFKIDQPQLSPISYWIAAIITSILLFASVLFHELSHSLLAKASGIEIKGISLFIFGGLAQISKEPSNAKTEFKIAIAGPAGSLFLASVFLVFTAAFKILYETSLIGSIFYYLFLINALLALFNLMPGFPLDGGRILRAYLWHRTGDYNKATTSASRVGKWFALLLMIGGFYNIIADHMFNGLWLILIGLFLRQAAAESLRLVNIYRALSGIRAKDIMTPNIIAVSRYETLENLVTNYFLKYRFTSFPVIEDQSFIGIISINDIKNIPRKEWDMLRIKDIIASINKEDTIQQEEAAVEALKKMISSGKSYLAVMEANGELVGIVTRRDIMNLYKIKAHLMSKDS